ncbi:aryl-alcohol dehydrogenase-like predicted oxidoreductase [Kibdelosporangium banguiense]|uniref:Aryl-alcohol dehydrogenase-like predicted oxidoreductase n=1 Tax=Kibdelosporangium banguiense TaxID=1365924 RepID=A0ABS4U1B4_9PSEU|nr:aryl-alcohol dehydrogenase-like predicted oxidoreductase [Kibdelosporangium banguiense]
MQYRTLGHTGVQVSALALGAMNFGKIGRTTQDEATAIVDAALQSGINVIDTADIYSAGESEEMVGKAIAGRRDDIVLVTKANNPMGDERDHRGSSRRWLVTELDNSLRRLGVDVLDAIDSIVAPGVDLAPGEKFDTPPALLEKSLRRR